VPKVQRGLGRGLDALLSTKADIPDGDEMQEIEIQKVIARKNQPRSVFNGDSLQELANSIREHGVLQPILVKPKGEEYEIVAGERRWRAAYLAGIEKIPAIIKEISKEEAAEISLIENLQRDDLSVVEEAKAYKNMMGTYGYTQESLARRIGKSRSHIANILRILGLPEEVLDLLEQRKLTAGHARALLAIQNEREQINMAHTIVNDKISVRRIEDNIKKKKAVKKGEDSQNKDDMIEIKEIEERIQKHLGTKAEIVKQKKGGKIVIEYYNMDDLDRIIDMIGI